MKANINDINRLGPFFSVGFRKGAGGRINSLTPLSIKNRLLNRAPPRRMKVGPDLTLEMIVLPNLKYLVRCTHIMGMKSLLSKLDAWFPYNARESV